MSNVVKHGILWDRERQIRKNMAFTHPLKEVTYGKKFYCLCKLGTIRHYSTMAGPVCVGKKRLGLIFQFLDAAVDDTS